MVIATILSAIADNSVMKVGERSRSIFLTKVLNKTPWAGISAQGAYSSYGCEPNKLLRLLYYKPQPAQVIYLYVSQMSRLLHWRDGAYFELKVVVKKEKAAESPKGSAAREFVHPRVVDMSVLATMRNIRSISTFEISYKPGQ